ncbi:uncharacterized protein PAC_07564 [Phialocephala subalpina]|uniref:Uncharacterized protein n=1 Tax=Phialocephala subalpina TaxID=576137 RepID=A0A1L7WY39_9HELO|nr:uncharacterized protein PAC_07564 [Phialocephala subalpina]
MTIAAFCLLPASRGRMRTTQDHKSDLQTATRRTGSHRVWLRLATGCLASSAENEAPLHGSEHLIGSSKKPRMYIKGHPPPSRACAVPSGGVLLRRRIAELARLMSNFLFPRAGTQSGERVLLQAFPGVDQEPFWGESLKSPHHLFLNKTDDGLVPEEPNEPEGISSC